MSADAPKILETPEAAFACEAVRRATQLARLVQSEMVTPALTKGDRSPVTVADFAVQAVVAKLLDEALPEATLVGEEDAAELRTPQEAASLEQVTHFVKTIFPDTNAKQVCDWIDHGAAEPNARFWTLDPIDGTKGFLRGGHYAVALGLIVDGRVELGVLGCPHLTDGWKDEIGGPGSVIVAARGQGAWTAGIEGGAWTKLSVSDRAQGADARMLRSFESGHTNTGQMGELVEALGTKADPVLMDSQAKYAVLASGAGDLLMRLLSSKQPDYREKIWDQAAGSIVVEEAGGTISDLDGRPLDFSHGRTLATNRGVLASNSLLHDVALAALKSIGA